METLLLVLYNSKNPKVRITIVKKRLTYFTYVKALLTGKHFKSKK